MGNNKHKLTHSEVLRNNFGYQEAEMENKTNKKKKNKLVGEKERTPHGGEIRRRSDITTLSANGNKRKRSLPRPLPPFLPLLPSPLSCGYFRDLPIQFWCFGMSEVPAGSEHQHLSARTGTTTTTIHPRHVSSATLPPKPHELPLFCFFCFLIIPLWFCVVVFVLKEAGCIVVGRSARIQRDTWKNVTIT